MASTSSPSPQPNRRRAGGPAKSLISLTPLIDVVFILLVFFMLASSFLDWRVVAVRAAAPTSESAVATGLQGAVLVDVEADGTLRLSGQQLARDQLVARVAGLVAQRPDAGIILRPAPGVSMQALVDLIDLLTARGVSALSVQRGS
ncbi:MAG: ExbD/TolR family protein [Alphaproteobacteria bacterium]